MYSRCKELRESKNLTKKQLAEYLGVAPKTYASYEDEKRKSFPTMALIKIAKFYDVSVDYLLGRSDTPKLPK